MTAELIPMLAPDFGDLPSGVWAVQSTREGGVSTGPWYSLNLALHTGDNPEHVAENRYRLEHSLGIAEPVAWPRQVHGTRVIRAEDLLEAWEQDEVLEADAVFTDVPGVVCAVQTADCLPVVLATDDGEAVAVAHAGWRGLADGVLEAAVEALRITRPEAEIRAWMGAAIGPEAFEVGPEVRDTFLDHDVEAAPAFRPGPKGHFHADIYALARHRLERVDVVHVAGGGRCTYSEAGRFYSYRRDGETGRMGTLAWIGHLDEE
ncbi:MULTISPECIES: peptidoglycan editing factor PgeF [unclassified Thioalkalivibrio]|uniref:peptidoglycan editing factor PgeF n=1 Tax=unclassified Thioalkalivibrio TaxID=2621013 RepID=UPI00036C1CC2|nr:MULTISPECIES: peptidoglycan editing factor PgeF [unclassified Thioalkalivibrio]